MDVVKYFSSSRPARSIAALVAVGALVASCGSDDDATDTGSADTEAPADDASADDGAADVEPAGLVEIAPVTVDGLPLPPHGDSPDDPAVGTTAPVVTGQTFDGSEFSIGGATPNPTFVVFLAHWCPACNAEVPELVQLADDDAYPEGLDVIGVATASTDQRDNFPPSQWLDDFGWTFPVMVDSAQSDAFTAFGGTGFPYGVVLDADGTVLARTTGPKPADETLAFLEDALASASS